MNLYVITLNEDLIDYDCMIGYVIQANSEYNCRLIAAGGSDDEGSEVWINPKYHELKLIGTTLKEETEEKIILDSYNAG